jgi:hypothetical protein
MALIETPFGDEERDSVTKTLCPCCADFRDRRHFLHRKSRPVDNLFDGLPGHGGLAFDPNRSRQGEIMAKRKKASKVQKKKGATARPKARKVSKAARGKATKQTAKPKPAPVKKAARKVKQPVAQVVETVAAEVIEQPAPGVGVGLDPAA